MVASWLTETGAGAGALLAVLGLLIALGRLRPLRWVWRRLVSEPFGTFFRAQVEQVVDPKIQAIRDDLSDHMRTEEASSASVAKDIALIAQHIGLDLPV